MMRRRISPSSPRWPLFPPLPVKKEDNGEVSKKVVHVPPSLSTLRHLSSLELPENGSSNDDHLTIGISPASLDVSISPSASRETYLPHRPRPKPSLSILNHAAPISPEILKLPMSPLASREFWIPPPMPKNKPILSTELEALASKLDDVISVSSSFVKSPDIKCDKFLPSQSNGALSSEFGSSCIDSFSRSPQPFPKTPEVFSFSLPSHVHKKGRLPSEDTNEFFIPKIPPPPKLKRKVMTLLPTTKMVKPIYKKMTVEELKERMKQLDEERSFVRDQILIKELEIAANIYRSDAKNDGFSTDSDEPFDLVTESRKNVPLRTKSTACISSCFIKPKFLVDNNVSMTSGSRSLNTTPKKGFKNLIN